MTYSNRSDASRMKVLAILAAVAAPVLAFACSANDDPKGFDPTGPSSAASTGAGGEGAGGGGPGFDGGLESPLELTPIDPVLKLEVPLTGQTIQFSCTETLGGGPAPEAKWSLSNLELGTISDTGLFTPNGKRAGTVNVRCESGTEAALTTLKVIIHGWDDKGGLTDAQKAVLKGPGGAGDNGWKFLYPYDNTVFPRGILAPEVHLEGGAPAEGFYMQIAAKDYEYEGFFGPGTPTQLVMAQEAWEAMANSAGGTDVEIRVSKLANNQKLGPIFRKWRIAAGPLKGTIYYNTYDTAGGAIMRVKGNSPVPEVLSGNCTVCHSVSADGSTAAAAGGTYDLSGGQLNPPMLWSTTGERAAFPGFFPDGSVLVIDGTPSSQWPPNIPGKNTSFFSELRTKQGAVIADSGIEPYYAQSPIFSHDGTMLAFYDRSPTPSGDNPNGGPYYPGVLALMDYDAATQKFSNYQVLATPPPGRHYSWPAFTPDGKYVIFQDGIGEDLATWQGNTGKMLAIDVATKQITPLNRLNGDGYMPQGARDENKNYEPTTTPIASGGYFWVLFTSRRTWGNELSGTEDVTKRLWVAAIDINAPPGQDSSHPAFYLQGQEVTSGNSRGFWALDPCKPDGQGCESGDECCNGFCNPTGDPPQFLCGPPDGQCSEEFEACDTSADCCDQTLDCINGKCAQLPPD